MTFPDHSEETHSFNEEINNTTAPNHSEETDPSSENSNDAKELGKFALGGAAAGAGVSYLVGGMGLAVAGTAVGIGLIPIVAAGAVVGTAAYGVKKALFDSPTTPADSNQPSTMENATHTASNIADQATNAVSEVASWISEKAKNFDKPSSDNNAQTPGAPNQPSTTESITHTVSSAANQAADTVSKWTSWVSKKVKGADKPNSDSNA